MQIHGVVIATDGRQLAVFADSLDTRADWVADRLATWLNDPRTALIEQRDEDERVRAVAWPRGSSRIDPRS